MPHRKCVNVYINHKKEAPLAMCLYHFREAIAIMSNDPLSRLAVKGLTLNEIAELAHEAILEDDAPDPLRP